MAHTYMAPDQTKRRAEESMKKQKKLIIMFLLMVLFTQALLPLNIPFHPVITANAATVSPSKKTVSVALNKKTTIELKNTSAKKKVTWSGGKGTVSLKSSGKNGAKVTITGKKAGTVTISASYAGKKYSCKVTVKAPPKKLKLAIARDTTGNTGSVVSMLRRCGGVSYAIVDSNCNVSKYDGLILPGGVDINPALYHQKNTASKGINKKLDQSQYKLLDKFVKAKKPVLGLCRGMQLINVYFGGTLKQNISKHRGVTHATSVTEDSWVYQIYKKKRMNVNSWHHQAVAKLGENLVITQEAVKDHIPEALEHKTLPVYGVQYHPEIMSGGEKIFQKFIKQCRQPLK